MNGQTKRHSIDRTAGAEVGDRIKPRVIVRLTTYRTTLLLVILGAAFFLGVENLIFLFRL
jgi:hypothetical protein